MFLNFAHFWFGLQNFKTDKISFFCNETLYSHVQHCMIKLQLKFYYNLPSGLWDPTSQLSDCLNFTTNKFGSFKMDKNLGPVVQSIVSLRGQLTKFFYNEIQIFLLKDDRSFCSASHIFSTKNIGRFQILTCEI